MQMRRSVLCATLAALLCAPAAWAQQSHVISQRALDQAVQQRVTQEQADREEIRQRGPVVLPDRNQQIIVYCGGPT